ncbi:antigen peptide transporter 1 [Amia ocellicauda]|uniref:antigen peptide transporter 1 n=1 Tax=Amia ocellicauda TaxID=2972642 RepID=UPI003463ABC1
MRLWLSLTLLLCADLGVVQLLRWAHLSYSSSSPTSAPSSAPSLQHQPLITVWGGGLLRALLLLLLSVPLSLPVSLGPPLVVLFLLCPSYCSLRRALALPLAELQWGWHSWPWVLQGYLVTAVGVLLYRRYGPSLCATAPTSSSAPAAGVSLRRLLGYMRPDAKKFGFIGVFLVVSSLGEMAIPFYTGRMTDWIMNEDEPEAFTHAITAMTLITVMSAVCEFVCDLIYNVTMSLIHTRIQGLVFSSVLKQEIAFFDSMHTGDIVSRITTDTNTMSESLSEKLSLLMWYLMRVLFLFSFMLRLSGRLALFTALGLPLIWLVPEFSGKFYQSLSAKVQSSLAKANDVATETFSLIKTVRSFANEEGEARRYAERLEETYTHNKTEAAAYALSTWTNSLSSLALKVSILYYGGRLVTGGDVSSGDLVSFVLYELQFTSAVEVLLNYYPHVKKAIGASEKIFEFMDRELLLPPEGHLAPKHLRGHVEFRNVSFSYPSRPDTPVLKGVSLELRPGQVTALVGPSGGGKSTCVSLLERFYQPQQGQILLDGQPLYSYEHQYLHHKIAVVSQEPVLFARSVQENIAYGQEEVDKAEVTRAAKLAHAHTFIDGLQSGYDTDAGEKGGQLSGGQKQRIAIARALVRRPTVLVLDDATSSLDTESEHKIHQALLNSSRGCAVLLIAHRLAAVERAHEIVVLEGGQVVERGSHCQLLERGGSYWRLVRKQNTAFQRTEGTEWTKTQED